MTTAPGREARQLHLEPVARAARVAEQDELPADELIGDVHVAVVVEVGGGEPAAVRPRSRAEPDEAGRVRELAAARFSSTCTGPASLPRFVTGIAPFASTRSRLPVVVRGRPTSAPAGEVRAEAPWRTPAAPFANDAPAARCGRPRALAARVASRRGRAGRRRCSRRRDAHAGVRVGDARAVRARRRSGSRAAVPAPATLT